MAELKVESDKDNVVSSRLEGRWQFSEAISTRLAPDSQNHGVYADDKVVAKIPASMGSF